MKRIVLAILLLGAGQAYAQQGVKIQIPTGQGNSYQTVDPTHPLPDTFSQQVASIPTITVGGYVSGNCVGGFNSVQVAISNGQSGELTNFRILSPSGLTPTLAAYIFDANPSTSICTDKGAFSLSADDIDKIMVVPQSGTLSKTNSLTPSTLGLAMLPPRPFTAGGSPTSGVRTIYYALVSASSFTPTTVSDIHIRAGVNLH